MRHRRRWTVIAVLLLVAAVVLGSRLSFSANASDFLPRGGTPQRPLPVASGGGVDRIAIVVESDRSMTPAEIGPVIDVLASRLAAISGVRHVEYRIAPELRRFLEEEIPRHLLIYFDPAQLDTIGSRLSRAWMEKALLGVGGRVEHSRLALAMGIMRTDPLGVIDPAVKILRRLSGNTRVRIADGYFALPSQRAFFLTVEPHRSLAAIDSARAMVGAIDSVLRGVERDPSLVAALAGKRLFALGRPVAVVEGTDLAYNDVQRVGLASTIVVLFLLVACLRSLLAPAFIMGTVLYGIALTAGVAFLLAGSINPVGWVFIASLIGFGDEYALYILAHYWIAAKPGMSRSAALAAALHRPGPGILLGGLTSAVSFFSLIVVSYPVMVQLAWLSTLGVLIVVACSFTVLPLALSYTSPRRTAESRRYRWTMLADRLSKRRNPWWLLVWVALVAASLWEARTIRFEAHPWQLAVRGLRATAELDRMQQMLGASFTPFLMVSQGRTPEEALTTDRDAVRDLERVQDRAGVAAIVSLSRWLPPAEQQRADIDYVRTHAELFSAERFRRDFAAVASRMDHPDTLLLTRYAPIVSRYLNPHPEELTLDSLRGHGFDDFIGRHLQRDSDGYIAVSDVYLTHFPWAEGAVERFTSTVQGTESPALARVTFVGDALRGATHASVVLRDLIAATVLTLVLVVAVLAARFRRPSLILLCLVPLGIALAVSLGLMALLGIELNVLTLAVAPLILGVGSDYGIHIVDRLDRGQPVSQVLREISEPMLITTVTTIAGFGCFAFATFPGVREMGVVAAFGLALCHVASLHVLPIGYTRIQNS